MVGVGRICALFSGLIPVIPPYNVIGKMPNRSRKNQLRVAALALALLLLLLIAGGGSFGSSSVAVNKTVPVSYQNNSKVPEVVSVNSVVMRVLPGMTGTANVPLNLQDSGATDRWHLLVTDESGKTLAETSHTWTYEEGVNSGAVNLSPLDKLEAPTPTTPSRITQTVSGHPSVTASNGTEDGRTPPPGKCPGGPSTSGSEGSTVGISFPR